MLASSILLGGITAPNAVAGWQTGDNIRNMVGGGVNVAAKDACVNKVGDTTKVEFLVQHQPLTWTSDGKLVSGSGYIAIPKAMKNVKIELEAVGSNHFNFEDGTEMKKDFVKLSKPFQVPIQDIDENNRSASVPFFKVEKDMRLPLSEDEVVDAAKKTLVMKRFTDGLKFDTKEKLEKFDDKYKGELEVMGIPFLVTDDVPGTSPWYGNHNDDYDIYIFGSFFMPATFKVTGEVETNSNDTFVPVASSNIGWRSVKNDETGNYDRGDYPMRMTAARPWANVGALPPALPTDPVLINAYKENQTPHGNSISPRISPTREIPGDAKYHTIGSDIYPSVRGDVGSAYTSSWGIDGNKSVFHMGQLRETGEDGADLAAAEVTICENDTPTSTSSTPEKPSDSPFTQEETPSTSQEDTPSTSSSKPSTSQEDTPSTSSSKPSTSQEDTPSTSSSKPSTSQEETVTTSSTDKVTTEDSATKTKEESTTATTSEGVEESTDTSTPGEPSDTSTLGEPETSTQPVPENPVTPGNNNPSNGYTPGLNTNHPKIPFISTPRITQYPSPSGTITPREETLVAEGTNTVFEGPKVDTGGSVVKDGIFNKIKILISG